MYYTGIDEHKDNCFLTTVNDAGAVFKRARIQNQSAMILEYFHDFPRPHRAVVESTANWYWLNDLLESQGIELILAHAKYIKAIAYAKVKTDKVDSCTLAQLLRLDFVPQAHKIRPELRDLRDLMRARLRLIQKRTSSKNSIHRIGEKFNTSIELSESVLPDHLPQPYKIQILWHQEQVQLFNRQIKELEETIRPKLIANEDIQRLLWVPAVGTLTALTLYLEIDQIVRFPTEKHFFSYCRLVPGAKNSNRSSRHKSGSKDGNRHLKIAFTDAAVHATRYYPEIRAFYQKVLQRSNRAIAHTVVAKELARIVYHILKDKAVFRGFKGKAISRQKACVWPRQAEFAPQMASPNVYHLHRQLAEAKV
jgi:transposase